MFKKVRMLLIVLGLTLSIGCDTSKEVTPISLATVQGDEILFPTKGQWLVLNLWATWCGPCREEIPSLNKINGLDNVTVVGVNVEHLSEEALKVAIHKLDIQYPVLLQDPTQALDLPQIDGVPTTLILNPQGKWLKPMPGFQSHSALLRAIGIEERQS